MTRRPLKDKLTLYRRHAGKCAAIGKTLDQCDCVLWCHGQIGGKIIRQSLDTRSLSIADMRRKDLLAGDPNGPDGGKQKIAVGGELTIEAAQELFLKSKKGSSDNTQKLYQRSLEHFRLYCESRQITLMRQIEPLVIESYFEANVDWAQRTKIGRLTYLRVFFTYASKRKFIAESPAAAVAVDAPIDQPRSPFTHAEIARIFAALENIGVQDHRLAQYRPKRQGIAALAKSVKRFRPLKHDYERVRALILLMLYSGMRISDAVWLERSSLREDGLLEYRMIKTRARIKLPLILNPLAVEALKALPASRTYFFVADREGDYSEARQALRKGQHFQKHLPARAYEREMQAAMTLVGKVLRAAGLEGGCHRFRDTFAVNMLVGGADIFAVSQMLGHSDVKITQKHYLNLVPSYRERLSSKTSVLNYPAPACPQPMAVPA